MKKFISLLVMVFMSALLFGQSDMVLDSLYEKDEADTLLTSLLVLQAAGQLTFEATTEDAYAYLESQSWGPAILKDGETITTGSFSLLVMKSFDLPHGLMYNLLPIKRYALKEMLYMGYILGNPYPSEPMSSFDVVYVLASVPVDEEINKNYAYVDDVAEVVAEPEPTVVDNVDTPEVEPVVEEPTPEPVVEEPVVEEPALVPVVEEPVAEPVVEESVAETVTEEVPAE